MVDHDHRNAGHVAVFEDGAKIVPVTPLECNGLSYFGVILCAMPVVIVEERVVHAQSMFSDGF